MVGGFFYFIREVTFNEKRTAKNQKSYKKFVSDEIFKIGGKKMYRPILSEKLVYNIKKTYPPGTRIKLIEMDDPYAPVSSGTRGTVTFVDDAGTVHMKWDNGRTLGIVPNVDDFRKLSGDEIEAEKVQTEENNIVRMNL